MDNILTQLIISLLLGAAIGLERESGHTDSELVSAGGVRTYSLLAVLGALAGVFLSGGQPVAFALLTSAFILLTLTYYILGALAIKNLGITTEIAMLYTFFMGFIITSGLLPMQILVALSVVVLLILAFKEASKELVSDLSRHEIRSFISYAIIALVILPFLPNTAYSLSDIPFVRSILSVTGLNLGQYAELELFNPKHVWLVVVLITGLDVIGYALGRMIGKSRGFAVTSFVAGFISSTSATLSLSGRSKKSGAVNYLVGAAILANLASFLQIFLLITPLNPRWLPTIIPSIMLMVIAAGLLSAYFLKNKKEAADEAQEKQNKKIFSLWPALRFAALLITVKIVTGISLVAFGQTGFLVSSIIASMAGLDAILVNLADLAGKSISFEFALFTLLLVNFTNLAAKSVYSFLTGTRKFAWRFTSSIMAVAVIGFLGYLFAF